MGDNKRTGGLGAVAVVVLVLAGAVGGFGQEVDTPLWTSGSTAGTYGMVSPTPDSFVIVNKDGTPMVTVSMKDGTITYGKNYTPDAAAKIFWDAIGAGACKPAKPVAPSKQKKVPQHDYAPCRIVGVSVVGDVTTNCAVSPESVGGMDLEVLPDSQKGHAVLPITSEKQLGEWIERNCTVLLKCPNDDGRANFAGCLLDSTPFKLHCTK